MNALQYMIEDLIFCPSCLSKNIDVGKCRGFEDTLLIYYGDNECLECKFCFDADIGMVSYTNGEGAYLNYSSLNIKGIKFIKKD